MTRRRGKPVSFDAMVKLFMRNYNIPTKKDIEGIVKRLEHMEALLRSFAGTVGQSPAVGVAAARGGGNRLPNASETVFEIIRRSKTGVGVAEIQKKTGYANKKIRNIIYRLDKAGRITRIRRGIYTISL